MSLLYKNKEDVIYSCYMKQENGKIHLEFWSDCGKHGTDEILAEYKLTPKRLLSILNDRDDYHDDEL